MVSVLALVMALASAHPLHTTLTQLTEDPARHTVRAMVRVFAEDVSAAVARRGKVTPESVVNYSAAMVELDDRSGRRIALRSCGTKQTGDLVWVCLETSAPATLVGARVRNSMLCELYDDQVNIVRSADRSLLFTRGDAAKAL